MSERSDGLAVFANSFRQADPFAPVRPPFAPLTNTLTNGSLPNQATQTLAIAVGDPNGPAYISSIQLTINGANGAKGSA